VKREVLSIPPIYIPVGLSAALLLSGRRCLSVASATIVAQLNKLSNCIILQNCQKSR